MSGLAAFLTGIGPRIARPRRGPLVAAILKLTARPLPGMLARVDRVTRWVVKPRRRDRGRAI